MFLPWLFLLAVRELQMLCPPCLLSACHLM
nr:MAG TPA: hypothetical protein [Caudoviricetes sp.]DAW70708.1 MAG TPA: hypothetical protein [Caudoviricetes sp.]